MRLSVSMHACAADIVGRFARYWQRLHLRHLSQEYEFTMQCYLRLLTYIFKGNSLASEGQIYKLFKFYMKYLQSHDCFGVQRSFSKICN